MNPKILEDRMQDGFRIVVFETCGMVCSQQIGVILKDNVINSVQFLGGCAGNTQGLASLLRGMNKDEAINRLKGINCGNKGTSCPDQLARGLEMIQ